MKRSIHSAIVSMLFLITASSAVLAQAPEQKTFATPNDAVDALIQTLRARSDSDLQAILGPDSEQIVSSGDAVADKNARDRFMSEYETKHALVKSRANRLTLNVGKDDWPLPIPLVHGNNKWYWDGAAGREELLYRRIGRNELAAIDVCKGVVGAQREYASAAHDGLPAGTYASRLVSDNGKQNGLYWPVQAGEPPSPAGPLLAQASAEGYDTSGKRAPYHGYYYRLLNKPGGFGFIAYPAEYRSSGVMTFIVDQSGAIYEKDLGEHTANIARELREYKRDNSWTRAN